MAGYWPSFFFLRVYGPRQSRGPKTRKKRTRPISSHLDRTSLVNKGFIIWLLGKCFLRDKAGSPERARWRVEALIFFRLLLSSCLNWKIHCEDHSSLSSMTAVQIYELFSYILP